MPRHDSGAPSLRPVRHYPHLLDIDPGPWVEWDFNLPETGTAGTQYGLLKLKNSKRFKSVHKFI